MHVHRADHGRAAHHVEHAKAHGHAKHADKAERREQRTETEGDRFEKSDEPGKMPGVVRNLLAGHYKGVAALRLAINHHDKIEAALNGSAQPVVSESLDELSGVVNEQVDALVQAAAPTQEQTEAIETLREQFQADLTELREGFVASPDRAGIEAAVRELTDSLLSEIETVLTPASPEPTPPLEAGDQTGENGAPADTIVATQPEQTESTQSSETPDTTSTEPDSTDLTDLTEPNAPDLTESPAPEPVDLSALLTTFRDAVETVLDNLSESLGAIKLPAPPPPTGHGKAYAKFLAMYEQLYSPAAPVESPEAAEQPAGIDVTA